MAILSKGTTFANAQQVASTNLNSLVDSAVFVSGPSGTTDDSTLEVNGSGRLQAKDGGITAAKLASDSVTTAKVLDGNITASKLSTGAPTWDGTSSITMSFADVSTIYEAITTTATTARNPQFRATGYGNGSNGAVQLRGANGNSATPTATQSADVLGQVIFAGHNGTDFQQTCRITAVATENFSGSAEGTVLRFATTLNGATAEAERMRISETGGLLIGTSTDVPSARLALGGTTKGFLPPVLTTAQRDAISSPAEGLMIYNTTTNKLNFYNGSAWEAVTSA